MSLITSTGQVDEAAVRAIAESRTAWAKNMPRYETRLEGALNIARAEAEDQAKRFGKSPNEVALLNLEDDIRALPLRTDGNLDGQRRVIQMRAAARGVDPTRIGQ